MWPLAPRLPDLVSQPDCRYGIFNWPLLDWSLVDQCAVKVSKTKLFPLFQREIRLKART